jgi:hypothetical protein
MIMSIEFQFFLSALGNRFEPIIATDIFLNNVNKHILACWRKPGRADSFTKIHAR